MRRVLLLSLIACGAIKTLPSAAVMDAAEEETPWIAVDGGDGPTCKNLECQVPQCGTAGDTTITGTVRDPGGTLPLYGVYVFVPNEPLQPMPQGVQCGPCQPPVTGAPMSASLSDAAGHYRMSYAPAGAAIPIVVQSGYFRRQITVPIKPCEENVIDLRLPRNQSEGELPLVAVTTGCDRLECFLHDRVGLDWVEMSGPKGKGRVHVYRGTSDSGQGLPTGAGDAATLLADLSLMKKYNAIVLSSECSPTAHDTAGDGYGNIKAYIEAGGRVYATHNEFNFFADASQCASTDHCGGSLGSVASWKQPKGGTGPHKVSVTFPKGKAMNDWYRKVTALPAFAPYATTSPEVPLVDTFPDVGPVAKPTTLWGYRGDQTATYDTTLLSFWVPLNINPDKQCGRAFFLSANATGAHANGPTWPESCDIGPIDHTPNELLLEFALFDMPSCIQDDLH